MATPRPATASTPASSSVVAPPLPHDSWDCMLPGPPSRSNFGSADLSSSGLIAFAAGSSISVVDSRSMQLVATVPMPPPTSSAASSFSAMASNSSSSSSSSSSLSPFVTSVRWTPLPLRRDLLSTEPSSSHLLLAAADRQGRIALLDLRLRVPVLWFESDPPRVSVQDLCWVQARPDSYLLAAVSGPSSLSLYSTTTGRCVWKYDASPEFLSCIRRDPFDARHFCVIGLKGFLLSVKVLGETENDVVIKELQIRTDCAELVKLERDAANGGGSSSSSPASAVFPLYMVKFAFSPQWRHVLFVTFPKELVVFDLQYETVLFSTALPRGCGKFLDVLPDPNNGFLYCAHLDGKLSTWRRKE
ncbi:Guanine nucleotide-binding protein, beta subunit [Parasponia andersonii]|uniref:Guanine nucleotide-binding protein, beta subunit n=1 Tax=Parasponia andersonii TaxID=3476 RepID=A0A2P5CQ97_PARAD|nr:Guanine nucleotide-binding protein, beta subunit [Parasponia andersonii]